MKITIFLFYTSIILFISCLNKKNRITSLSSLKLFKEKTDEMTPESFNEETENSKENIDDSLNQKEIKNEKKTIDEIQNIQPENTEENKEIEQKLDNQQDANEKMNPLSDKTKEEEQSNNPVSEQPNTEEQIIKEEPKTQKQNIAQQPKTQKQTNDANQQHQENSTTTTWSLIPEDISYYERINNLYSDIKIGDVIKENGYFEIILQYPPKNWLWEREYTITIGLEKWTYPRIKVEVSTPDYFNI